VISLAVDFTELRFWPDIREQVVFDKFFNFVGFLLA
jgi:hypothetical protein